MSDETEPKTNPTASGAPVTEPPPRRDTPLPASLPADATYLQAMQVMLDTANEIRAYRHEVTDPKGSVERGFARIMARLDGIDERLNRGASVMMASMLQIGELQGLLQGQRPPNGLRAKRVLIVEDDPSLRTLVHDLLISRGANVFATGTADEAVRIAHSVQVDAMLVDQRIPDVERGTELCEALLGAQPKVALVVISGAPEPARLEHLPIAAFIEKPAPLEHLEKTLHEAIDAAAAATATTG